MQADKTLNRSSLTLFNPTNLAILGELVDAEWKEEKGPQGSNYVLSGLASDGTLDTLQIFMDNGQDTVTFSFSDGKSNFGGSAFLLRPSQVKEPSGTEVRIETPNKPSLSGA